MFRFKIPLNSTKTQNPESSTEIERNRIKDYER